VVESEQGAGSARWARAREGGFAVKFTYRLIKETSGYVAECVESDAAGEGTTADEAVESLRVVLDERMCRPDAVAPPAAPVRSEIDLELAVDKRTRKSIDLGGPGG